MKSILNLYWNICLFRRGPEDVPGLSVILGITLILNILVSLVVGIAFGKLAVSFAAISLVISTATVGFLIYTVLMLKKLEARFRQTFTAVLGTDILITLLCSPLLWLVNQREQTAGLNLPGSVLLGLMIWDLLIKGFIYQRAFDVGRFQGNLFSFSLFMLLTMLSDILRKQMLGTG